MWKWGHQLLNVAAITLRITFTKVTLVRNVDSTKKHFFKKETLLGVQAWWGLSKPRERNYGSFQLPSVQSRKKDSRHNTHGLECSPQAIPNKEMKGIDITAKRSMQPVRSAGDYTWTRTWRLISNWKANLGRPTNKRVTLRDRKRAPEQTRVIGID